MSGLGSWMHTVPQSASAHGLGCLLRQSGPLLFGAGAAVIPAIDVRPLVVLCRCVDLGCGLDSFARRVVQRLAQRLLYRRRHLAPKVELVPPGIDRASRPCGYARAARRRGGPPKIVRCPAGDPKPGDNELRRVVYQQSQWTAWAAIARALAAFFLRLLHRIGLGAKDPTAGRSVAAPPSTAGTIR
jgi:hypothetical protein